MPLRGMDHNLEGTGVFSDSPKIASAFGSSPPGGDQPRPYGIRVRFRSIPNSEFRTARVVRPLRGKGRFHGSPFGKGSCREATEGISRVSPGGSNPLRAFRAHLPLLRGGSAASGRCAYPSRCAQFRTPNCPGRYGSARGICISRVPPPGGGQPRPYGIRVRFRSIPNSEFRTARVVRPLRGKGRFHGSPFGKGSCREATEGISRVSPGGSNPLRAFRAHLPLLRGGSAASGRCAYPSRCAQFRIPHSEFRIHFSLILYPCPQTARR